MLKYIPMLSFYFQAIFPVGVKMCVLFVLVSPVEGGVSAVSNSQRT